MNSLRKQFPREYRIWKAMRARCNAPCFKDSVYQRRKIKVCNRWDSFDSFMQDMGKCPPKYSIDRIDTYGDYCPENCRWASQEEQCKNRGKFNLIYTYQGETLCLKDWAKKFDIKVCLIKNGYPPQYSPEVFRKVMEQVENFEENN